MSMQTPIFEGVLNTYPLAKLLANGPPDYLPGIRKKAVCAPRRCNPFIQRGGFYG
jgi:hypothetical protein